MIEDESGSTSFEYDVRGLVIKETRKTGTRTFVVQYAYDEAGNLIGILNPANEFIEYEYDDTGRLTNVYFQGQLIVNYDYNPSSTIRYQNLHGVITDYTYNNRDLLTSIKTSVAGQDIFERTYSYSDNNNLLNIYYDVSDDDPGGTLNLNSDQTEVFSYDRLNRLIGAVYYEDRDGSMVAVKDIAYEYDFVGNREKMFETLEGGARLETTYDYQGGTNRLEAVIPEGGNPVTIEYDPVGNMLSKSDDTTYVYNFNNMMIESIIDDVVNSYDYDYLNRRVKKTTPEGSTYYVYGAGQVIYELFVPDTSLPAPTKIADKPTAPTRR
jgi:YD repeat-containing protein